MSDGLRLGSGTGSWCRLCASVSSRTRALLAEFLRGEDAGKHSAAAAAATTAFLTRPVVPADPGLGLLHRAAGQCHTEDHHNPRGFAAGEVRGPGSKASCGLKATGTYMGVA